MKKIIAIICALLAIAYASPKYTSATFIYNKTIKISGNDTIDNITIETFIPNNSSNQAVDLIYSSDNFTIKDGKAIFYFEKIRERKIVITFKVKTDYIRRKNYEEKVLSNYSKESKNIVFNDEIYNVTNDFREGFPDYPIDALDWIEKNIQYSLPYNDVNYKEIYENTMSSAEVIKSKKGVCDEFSNLFVAFMRIKNIPSRIVVGEVLVDNKWIPHAWTEIYSQKYGWIEVDPTFGEFLNLDPFRIKYLSVTDVSDAYERVIGRSKGNISYESFSNIEILNFSNDATIETDAKFLDKNESEKAIVTVRNNEKDPIFTKIEIITPKEIKCNCTKEVFLEENSLDSMEFELNLPKMEKNVKYTYPIILLTDYSQKDFSFSRLILEEPVRERDEIVNEKMKLFIGIFLILMIGLIIISIWLKL
jgi:transglutaminase-like putative cysteine protease